MTLPTEPDARLCRRVFESFAADAVTDLVPILARHRARYTELLIAGEVQAPQAAAWFACHGEGDRARE